MNKEIVKPRKIRNRAATPSQRPVSVTWLKQSNIVTLMRCDYGVMHYKVLVNVIHKLQSAMDESLNGVVFEQLALFREFDNRDRMMVSIQYKDFGIGADQYHQIKRVLKDLSTIPVELDTIDPISGKPAWSVSGLFKAYIPKQEYARYCSIEIEKEVARALVNMTKGFTKYGKEIAMKAKSKYTVPLYFLISSWKSKGGFSITVENLRKKLKLENKYAEYKDLYKRVIKPAYDELYEMGDCWFEMSEVFRENEKMPYKLNFKVIKGGLTHTEKEYLNSHTKNLAGMLERDFHLEEKHIKKVLEYIDINNVRQALDKTMELFEYVRQNADKITSIPEYCVKAIVNDLVPNADVIEEVEEYAEAE